MNFQKHVKVKSRWLQSSQMEMMMEESQSSLDMSDTVTDVSTSDINESTDYSSKLKSIELRSLGRTGSSNFNHSQLNGSKIIPQRIKQNLTSKTPTKKNRKKILFVNNFKIVENNCKNDSQNFNIISSLACNNDEIDDKLPLKSFCQIPLSSELALKPKNEKDSNLIAQDKNKQSYVSYETNHLEENNTVIKMDCIPSNDYCSSKQIFENVKNIPRQLNFSENDNFISENFDVLKNGVSNIELNTIYLVTNSNEQKFIKLNEENKYSKYKSRKMRSKSCDILWTKVNINNTIRRYKSFDDIYKSDMSVVDFSKFQISQKKKRRQSKRIKPKNNCIEIFDDMIVPNVNYDQVADEIYAEHENQLLQARLNDKELDEKLKSTNFTLINENLYRPNK